MTVFIRLLAVHVDDKPSELLRSVKTLRDSEKLGGTSDQATFVVDPAAFESVPGSPFAYWISNRIRQLFRHAKPLASDGRLAVAGLQTSDDFRFVRAWWEVAPASLLKVWWPFAKGGQYSPFRSSMNLVVNWQGDGHETKAFAETTPGSKHWSRNLRNAEHYFRPGLTWLRRSHRVCASVLPTGALFSDGAQAILAERSQLASIGGAVNSAPFDALVKLAVGRTGAGVQFMPGMIANAPIFAEVATDRRLDGAFRRGFSAQHALATGLETSHAFVLPPGLNERVTRFNPDVAPAILASVQREIDDLAYELYGIDPADHAAIEASSTRAAISDESTEDGSHDEWDDPREDETSIGAAPDALRSWLVGVAFGRFDPHLATGERAIPREPEPFDPLPLRSPGMYADGEEPADRPDILVHDEGHRGDLAARAHAGAERVKVDVPENLAGWLAKEFFPLHIKMYSKSRRKAPIYWQLATPSASYSVWLYIHAFSKDTFFRVQNDYVAPKLAHEERRLESLTNELRDGASAAERKVLAVQETLVEELRAFLDEVKRVAPLWKPNLDDGVIINFAPLWRLVPQNKSWQKELKSTWGALCEGKYDWAHLAMHLWPERVVPKCAKDRSLAIAHGLEDVFWVEGTDGKWTVRKTPTRSVDDLVRDRAAPSVKSALKSLLEAPMATQKTAGPVGRRKVAGAVERRDV